MEGLKACATSHGRPEGCATSHGRPEGLRYIPRRFATRRFDRSIRYARPAAMATVPPSSAAPAYVTGPGGAGMLARAASDVARRGANSSFILAAPCAIAQR